MRRLKKLLGHIVCDPALVNCDCLRHCFYYGPVLIEKTCSRQKAHSRTQATLGEPLFPTFPFFRDNFSPYKQGLSYHKYKLISFLLLISQANLFKANSGKLTLILIPILRWKFLKDHFTNHSEQTSLSLSL